MVVDDFVGTKVGEHLEVIARHGKTVNNGVVYNVICHKCKLDEELFGDGVFQSVKRSLLKGYKPCGCSPTYLWSRNQYLVRVNRMCSERGYKLIGIAGNWMKHKTKLHLKCLKDGFEWDSTTINHLLSGGGCPACKKEICRLATSKPDSEMIESFKRSGKFLEGTVFSRSDGEKAWTYTCPVCSIDEYVAAGLCSGVFKSTSTGLQQGERSCRCSKKVNWTQDQREHQIKRALQCEHIPTTFIRWVDDFSGNTSKFTLKCERHGTWDVSVQSFITRASRCPSCANYGYDKSKEGYLYVLLAEGDNSSFTGYGITNFPDARLKTHNKELAKGGFSVKRCEIFKGCGKVVLSIETKLKSAFEVTPQTVKGFVREATKYYLYEDVVEFVTQQINIKETHETNVSLHD